MGKFFKYLPPIKDAGNCYYGRESQENQQLKVISLIDLGALQGQDKGPGHTGNRGDKDKDLKGHGAQAEQVGQRILWKARKQEENKGNDEIPFENQVIEFAEDPRLGKPGPEGIGKEMANRKGQG